MQNVHYNVCALDKALLQGQCLGESSFPLPVTCLPQAGILLITFFSMRIVVSAPHLTPPTVETIESVAHRRFKSVTRLLQHMKDTSENYIQVSVQKEGDIFVINTELHAFERLFVSTKHRDVRIALKDAAQDLKRVIKKARGR